jgi:hypothetical protein
VSCGVRVRGHLLRVLPQPDDVVELDADGGRPQCAHLLRDRVRQAGQRNLSEARLHQFGLDRVERPRQYGGIAGAQPCAQASHGDGAAEPFAGHGCRGAGGGAGVARLGEHRQHGGADLVGGDGGGAGHGSTPAPGGKEGVLSSLGHRRVHARTAR